MFAYNVLISLALLALLLSFHGNNGVVDAQLQGDRPRFYFTTDMSVGVAELLVVDDNAALNLLPDINAAFLGQTTGALVASSLYSFDKPASLYYATTSSSSAITEVTGDLLPQKRMLALGTPPSSYLAYSEQHDRVFYYDTDQSSILFAQRVDPTPKLYVANDRIAFRGMVFANDGLTWICYNDDDELSLCRANLAGLDQTTYTVTGAGTLIDVVYDPRHDCYYAISQDTLYLVLGDFTGHTEVLFSAGAPMNLSHVTLVTDSAEDLVELWASYESGAPIPGQVVRITMDFALLLSGFGKEAATKDFKLGDDGVITGIAYVTAAPPVAQPASSATYAADFASAFPGFAIQTTLDTVGSDIEETTITFGRFASAGAGTINFPSTWVAQVSSGGVSDYLHRTLLTTGVAVEINSRFSATEEATAYPVPSVFYTQAPGSVKFSLALTGSGLFADSDDELSWYICYQNTEQLGLYNLDDMQTTSLLDGQLTRYTVPRLDTEDSELVINVPTAVLIDGEVVTNITHQFHAERTPSGTLSICMAWQFPSFTESLFFDPDIGVLVQQGGDGEDGSSSDDDTDSDALAIAVAVSVGGACFLVCFIIVAVIIVVMGLTWWRSKHTANELGAIDL